MSSFHVLRVRRTDGDYVLVNVQQIGSSPLDVKLIGTDGNAPFVAEIKQANIAGFKEKKHQASLDEWTKCLSAILLQQPSDSAAVIGVEAAATVTDQTISLAIRKNISGITQRLGAIQLVLNEDEQIELFDWTVAAASTSDDLRDQLSKLQTSMNSQQQRIADLTAELDGLVKAKKSHEDMLLNKFAALLNSKKLKIRDQQRLLAHAKIDPKAAAQVQRTRSTSTRKVAASRPSKRKANGGLTESDLDEDGGSERSEQSDGDADMNGAATPEKSDLGETEDDASDADGFGPAPVQSQPSQRGAGGKGKAFEAAKSQSTAPTVESAKVTEPPPRRELPFAKKTEPKPPPAAKEPDLPVRSTKSQPVLDSDGDETTDDEL